MHRDPRVPTILTRLALLAAVLAAPQPAAAAPPATAELPPAETLLEAFVATAGGAEAVAQVDTARARGTVTFAAMGISGAYTVLQARPDHNLSTIELEGLGRIRSGTGDGVAWELSDIQGPRLLEGGERAFALRSSRIDGYLAWRELYESWETVGVDAERDCWLVRMTPTAGNPETWCLGRESHLLEALEVELETAMGTIPVAITVEEYREVDGVRTPVQVRQRMLGQEIVITLDEVAYGVEHPPGTFALPEEVKALLPPAEETPEPEAGAAGS